MKSPFDPVLNVAIVHIASRLLPNGFDVSDEAPDTYEKLKAHLCAGKRMIVWSGGSEATVYGHRSVNFSFRTRPPVILSSPIWVAAFMASPISPASRICFVSCACFAQTPAR